MRRLEQRGAVAFAVVIFIPADRAVGLALANHADALARMLDQPKLFAFWRTSSSSLHRKLAVCANVSP